MRPGLTRLRRGAKLTAMQPTQLAPLADAQAAYILDHPDYAATHVLDQLRATEYARLDRAGNVFLDHTAGGMYSEKQIREHADLLTGGVFGNPHSSNAASAAMTEWVVRTRARVLEHFNASPDEYVVCFAQNASAVASAASAWASTRVLTSESIALDSPAWSAVR